MSRPRTCFLFFASLLLGAITTTLSAWALACTDIPSPGLQSAQTFHPERGEVTFTSISAPANGIRVTVFADPGRTSISTECCGPDAGGLVGIPVDFFEPSKLAPDQLVPASLRAIALPWLYNTPWPRGGDEDWRSVEASGWPLLALATCHERTRSFTQRQSWGISLPTKHMRIFGRRAWGPNTPCILPLRPLFPGFLLNTLLYAALWFALFLLPGALRRTLRRRRNHCPTCNYDLRATPVKNPCPECGTRSPRRNPAPARP